MNSSPITAEIITVILDDHDVPTELRTDPEIQAIAYGLAFLDLPATLPEERFYNAATVFYDEADHSRYEVDNHCLLQEQLGYRLSLSLAHLA